MRFRDDFWFCSNFYPAAIDVEGLTYPTTEHYYAAQKCAEPADANVVRLATTPGQAKRWARDFALRGDWERVKLDVMRTALWAKFTQHPKLAAKLRATSDVTLVEDNTWGDRFWGVCNGDGLNWLGTLLMDVRARLVDDPLQCQCPGKRILVCGGRAFGELRRDATPYEDVMAERAFVHQVLDRVHRERTIAVVIAGGRFETPEWRAKATGADWFGLQWAVDHDLPIEEYPAYWEQLGGRAGPLRNQRMLVYSKPDAVIAFPGDRGTQDMVTRAKAAHVPVFAPPWRTP